MGIFLIYSFSGCFIGFVLFCVSLSGHVTGLYFQVQNMGHESDLVRDPSLEVGSSGWVGKI